MWEAPLIREVQETQRPYSGPGAIALAVRDTNLTSAGDGRLNVPGTFDALMGEEMQRQLFQDR